MPAFSASYATLSHERHQALLCYLPDTDTPNRRLLFSTWLHLSWVAVCTLRHAGYFKLTWICCCSRMRAVVFKQKEITSRNFKRFFLLCLISDYFTWILSEINTWEHDRCKYFLTHVKNIWKSISIFNKRHSSSVTNIADNEDM